MNKLLIRGVAAALIPCILFADPSWAVGMKGAFPSPRGLDKVSSQSALLNEAIVPLQISGFRFPSFFPAVRVAHLAGQTLHNRRVRSLTLSVAVLLNSLPFHAQNQTVLSGSKDQTHSKQFPDSSHAIPSTPIPELMRRTKTISETSSDDLWYLGAQIPEHIDQLDDFSEAVIDNSPDLLQRWLTLQASAEQWFAAASPQKVVNYASDFNRTAALNLAQNFGPSVSDMVLFPRYENRTAFQRYESSSSGSGDSGFWHTFFNGARDLMLNGGIQGTPQSVIEMNYIKVGEKATQMRIDFADMEAQEQTDIRNFQRTLYALMHKNQEIHGLNLDIRLAEKEKADWSSTTAYNTETGRLKPVEIGRKIRELETALSERLKERSDLEDTLRRQLIRTSGALQSRARFEPRPPTMVINETALERLANSRLPDDAHALTALSAPSETRLKNGLERRLKLVSRPRAGKTTDPLLQQARYASAFDPEYIALLLDHAWQVPGYHDTVFEKPADQNPRRIMDLDTLLAILPENDGELGTSPAEAGLQFQGRLLEQATNLLAQNKKSTLAFGLRLNLSAMLPIRPEITGTRVIDATQVDHLITSNRILQKEIPVKINEYRIHVALKEWLELRTRQLAAIRQARTTARYILEQYATTANELNPPSRSGADSMAVVDFQTPAEEIARGYETLRAQLITLQAVSDEAALLTTRGQDRMSEALAIHFVQSMKAVETLRPAVVEPSSPTPEGPVGKHKKDKKQKNQSSLGTAGKLGTLAAIILNPIQMPAADHLRMALPHPHYWTNPLLQLGTALALTLVVATYAAHKNGGKSNDSRPRERSYWGIHLVGAVAVAATFPGPIEVGVMIGSMVLALSRSILPKYAFSYGKNDLPYRIIHFLNSYPKRRAALQWIGRVGVLATVMSLSSPYVTALYHRLAGSLNLESDQQLQVSSQLISEPIRVGVPPKESGAVENNPLLRSRTTVSAGQWVVAWKGPRDAELLQRLNRINSSLQELGVKPIEGLAELTTDSPASRYQQALVQIRGFGEDGSIEGRMEMLASHLESTLPESKRAVSVADSLGGATGLEHVTKNDLAEVARVLSAVLLERSYRDVKANRSFEFVPSVDEVAMGKTVTGEKSLLLGTHILKDYARFRFIFSPSEAVLFEEFLHTPTSLATIEDAQSGLRLHFRPQDVRRTSEPSDGKGLLSEIYVNPDSGVIPQLRQEMDVHLPDGQRMPEGARNFHLVQFSGLKTRELPKGFKLAVVDIIPTGLIHRRYPGPLSALNQQAQAIQTAIRGYESLKASANAAVQLQNGTRAGYDRAVEARRIAEQSAERVAGLQPLLHSIEDRSSEWQKSGMPEARELSTGQGSAIVGKTYPVNPVAEETYPLQENSPVAFDASDSSSDHQAYYTIGNTVRLRISVHARDYSDLAVQPGQTLMMSIPGSNQEIPVTFVQNQEVRERDLPAARYVYEVTIPAAQLSVLFPQVAAHGAPVGEAIVFIRKVGTPTQPEAELSRPLLPTKAPFAFLILPTVGFMGWAHPLLWISVGSMALIGLSFMAGHWWLGGRITQWRSRKRGKRIEAVDVPQHESAPSDPILYTANGLFPQASRFQKVIGGGEITDGTIVSNDILQTLETNWKTIKEKTWVANAIAEGVNSIQDEGLLDRLALGLSISTTKVVPGSAYIDSVRDAVRDTLVDRFNQLEIVRLQTRRHDPIVDMVVLAHSRLAYIDEPVLSQLIETLSKTRARSKVRQAVQLKLLTLFYYPLASRDLLEPQGTGREGLGSYSLDKSRTAAFLKDMDSLLDYTDTTLKTLSEKTLTLQMDERRRERGKEKSPLPIGITGRERVLNSVGFANLTAMLQKTRLPYESSDSDADVLYNHFRTADVSRSLAHVLAEQYHVETVTKRWSNERTSFVWLIDMLWVGSFLAWVYWPNLLMATLRRLLLSNFTWALFYNPSSGEKGVPSLVLTGFLTMMVIAFFQGTVFKSISESLTANWYHIRRYWSRRRGNSKRLGQEFKRLTNVDAVAFLKNWHAMDTLQDTGEFQVLLQAYSTLIVGRVYRSLTAPKNPVPIEVKRRVVSALYQYSERPLHPQNAFFKTFPPLNLKTQEEVFQHIWPEMRLRADEIETILAPVNAALLQRIEIDLGRHLPTDASGWDILPVKDQWDVISALYRDGFSLNDDWRRDRMEEVRVQLALGEMLHAPTEAFLALVSRDLVGFAFGPDSAVNSKKGRQDEEMRSAYKAFIERLGTLAPNLYMSYREYSRYARMGRQIHYAIRVVTHRDAERAHDLNDAFTPVLSDLEIDATQPSVRPFLSEAQRTKLDSNHFIIDSLNRLQPHIPLVVMNLKRRLKLTAVRQDPTDRLALSLMLKHADGEYLDQAVSALSQILHFKLYDKTTSDLDALLETPDFFLFKKLAEQNHLNMKSMLEAYLGVSSDSERQRIMHDFLNQIELSSGLRNGLIFQLSRRLLKSDPDAHERLSRLLAPGEDADDPTLYPSYLMDRFLQDDQSDLITTFAGFLQVQDEASFVEDKLIDLSSSRGPRLYGRREIYQEAALDLNIRQAAFDMQRDAKLTSGDVNRIAVSRRGLHGFMQELFRRIPHRVPSSVAGRLHPLLLEQVLSLLHSPHPVTREIFISPEILSMRKLVDDTGIQDSDRIGVPNPFMTSAAKVLAWWYLMPAEKENFLESVRMAHGPEGVKSIKNEIDSLIYLVRSAHIQIRVYPERYTVDRTTGKMTDLLEKVRPPLGFNTIWMIPGNGFAGSDSNSSIHNAPPTAPLEPALLQQRRRRRSLQTAA